MIQILVMMNVILINNVLKNYDEMKKEIENLKT